VKLIVIGAGSWGTTLASLFGKQLKVSLWTHSVEHANEINAQRENTRYLKGIRLSDGVSAVKAFGEAIADDDIIMVVVPSRVVRTVADELKPILKNQTVICASKGFEHNSLKTMSQIISERLPQSSIVALSGPNIAIEVAKGKPTKAVLACKNLSAVTRVASLLKNDTISFEISKDIDGVELCAALKGIIAIGVGIADGLELGDNFTGVLMTYGLKEFVSIAEFLGISDKTIYGIAGLGDLIATCLSKNSRNRKFGYMLAKGTSTDDALKQVGMVVEGVQMAKTIVELENLNIAIPLFSTITKIIFYNHDNLYDTFVKCLMNYRGA
jgi:glycerol-3-phosphate dehydrogenase (NAD(P)+)